MKLLLVFGVLGLGALFFAPKHTSIAGTWVLDTKGKKAEAAVLRLQLNEGCYTALLDMPDQQVYDKQVNIRLHNDSICVVLDPNEDCYIKAAVTDSTLEGQSVVNGKIEQVVFHRAK